MHASYVDFFAFGGGGKMKEESEESEKRIWTLNST